MDYGQIVSGKLNIPNSCFRRTHNADFTCLVPDTWIRSLVCGHFSVPGGDLYESIECHDPIHLLARSTTRLPAGWSRVTVEVLEKSDNIANSLVEQPLCGANFLMTHAETIQRMAASMEHHMWLEARHKYRHAIWPVSEEPKQLPQKKLSAVTRDLLKKLYRCPIIAAKSLTSNSTQKLHLHQVPNPSSRPHPGLLNPHAVIEFDTVFLVVFPFEPYSLWDCITFSSGKLQESSIRQLFVFYQVLQSVRHCHRSCLSIGNVQLQDLSISDTCWVKLKPPGLPLNLHECQTKSVSPHNEISVESTSNPPTTTSQALAPFTEQDSIAHIPTEISVTGLPSLVQEWMLGRLSNFDYLMALNHLAGRRMFDPNHHPIMPWVMDLKSSEGSFRDLTKSKYRLNKGDHQLDVTYNPEDPLKDPLQVSHHIAEVLSDITYYVYKARRIPKSVLCKHVRQRWVPHEYPTSMERLQEWTPDECIPEFYSDPEIFVSIHDDLRDLEIPLWAENPADFVEKHRQVLEGDYVSQRLHHWIDLTFGYKLSGSAAVKAKNVCLQLVDQHTNLLNHGVVQLFNHPHPPRIVPRQAVRSLGSNGRSPKLRTDPELSTAEDVSQMDESITTTIEASQKSTATTRSLTDSTTDTQEPIVLPQGFQPVAALNHLEALYEFSGRVAGKLPEQLKDQPLPEISPHQSLVMRDMQVLGCLLVEIFMPSHSRSLGYGSSLEERFSLARTVVRSHGHELLRSVRHAVEELLQTSKSWSPEDIDNFGTMFHYDAVSEMGQPPPDIDLLLQNSSSVFQFPPYFRSLYWVLHKIHSLEEQEFTIEQSDVNILDKIRQCRKISKQKVYILGHYLSKASRQPGFDGGEILIPYITQLIESPVSSVQAAWSLFNPIAQIIGPAKTDAHFLKLLQKLFDTEQTTAKFIKIYHRSFVLQLIIRFGLESFLANFVSYLIEAIGRYKNFVDEDFIDRQISREAEPLVEVAEPGRASSADLEKVSIDSVEDALIYALEDEEVEMETNTMLDEVFEEGLLMNMDGPLIPEDTRSSKSSDTAVGDDQSLSEASGDTEESGKDLLMTDSANADLTEELLGKSLGRLSVHSVSRLMVDGEAASEGEDLADSSDTGNGNDSDSSNFVNVEVPKQADDQPSKTQEQSTNGNGNNSQQTNKLPSMVRSETDDFSTALGGTQEYNISDVASETIKWLAHRLGPVITAKHLSRNLLRMLMLCYMGDDQLQTVEKEGDSISASERRLVGDIHAAEVLECLSFIVVLYGEQVVLLQYFQHVRELIQAAVKKLTVRTEAGLVSCVALLVHILPYISDSTLMAVLQDTIFGEILLQIMKLVSSTFISFPSGSLSRSALCYKLVDILYIVSLRIGFEMTREHMTYVLQKFFAAFNRIYEDPSKVDGGSESSEDAKQNAETEKGEDPPPEDLYCELKVDTSTREYQVSKPTANSVQRHRRQGSLHSMLSPTAPDDIDDQQQEKTKDSILNELKETFTPELAHTAYIPFCKLAGGIYLEQNLINEELIRNLCMIHDQTLSQRQDQIQNMAREANLDTGPISPKEETSNVVSGNFGRNVSVSGNQIVIQDDKPPSDNTRVSHSALHRRSTDVSDTKLRNPEMKMLSQRHLKGNWLAYWEHEVGLGDREAAFNFKQIKLQTFSGHTSSVRAIHVLDNENSFVSASKDKTVKLWSLRNWGDGQAKEEAKWTYKAHKKSVFAVTFLEANHLMASCDSNVHIWDPFMEKTVSIVESPKGCPVTVMSSMPSPAPLLITINSDSIIRFLDSRTGRYSHEYKCSANAAGLVRCMTVSPNGRTLAVGYSTGVISTLDTRTGALIGSWKGHEGEILQIKSHASGKIATSCFDQTLCQWNTSGDRYGPLKGPTEPVHCMHFYRDTLLSATTGNKVGIHGALDKSPSYVCSKLRGDVFRGVLTTMAVLPLNRSLLLGADNGEIRLVA